QISGKKRWRYSRAPAVPFPTHNVVGENRIFSYVRGDPMPRPWEDFAPPDEREFEEVVLEPGDVLCLPAGTWHAAKAIDHSLALNLAFNPVPVWSILHDALEARLAELPGWRQSPPPTLVQPPASGAPPAAVTRFFQ